MAHELPQSLDGEHCLYHTMLSELNSLMNSLNTVGFLSTNKRVPYLLVTILYPASSGMENAFPCPPPPPRKLNATPTMAQIAINPRLHTRLPNKGFTRTWFFQAIT